MRWFNLVLYQLSHLYGLCFVHFNVHVGTVSVSCSHLPWSCSVAPAVKGGGKLPAAALCGSHALGLGWYSLVLSFQADTYW